MKKIGKKLTNIFQSATMSAARIVTSLGVGVGVGGAVVAIAPLFNATAVGTLVIAAASFAITSIAHLVASASGANARKSQDYEALRMEQTILRKTLDRALDMNERLVEAVAARGGQASKAAIAAVMAQGISGEPAYADGYSSTATYPVEDMSLTYRSDVFEGETVEVKTDGSAPVFPKSAASVKVAYSEAAAKPVPGKSIVPQVSRRKKDTEILRPVWDHRRKGI